ncbi:MAG: bifunctional homocysteine S-methyltransferase/methylenetetrahydrofolate reductase [Chloroflexi bacterium]|nr:bifunctional homocysteine S-methyltransferase/methylenetetrahydrofolate reductase [Chloroflexota bacterium]
MIHPFLERLRRGPVLCDGAMGTMLHARGVPYERSFDEVNLSNPDLIQQLHREYIAAGAELIETNTYGANRLRLARYGLESSVRDINFRGVKIAREAREVSGEAVFLAGAVGPIDEPLSPIGTVTLVEARAAFREQIDALLEAGADLILLETFSSLTELREAVAAAREACDLPLVAQMSFAEDGNTMTGEDPAMVANVLAALGVDVLGVNCGLGPQQALEVVEAMHVPSGLYLSAMPNAGFPSRVGGRYFYFSTPEYFAEYVRRLADGGARMIGGCCGTTPAHVAAMAEALKGHEAAPRSRSVAVTSPQVVGEALLHASGDGPTPWAQKLQAGKFVISVELDPPRGLNPTKILQGAQSMEGVGVDAINIGDSPMARVRMSCIALAVQIQAQTSLDTIIHFTTRDRNLMALQSELLGAHALGIRNVLALTGDPPRIGSYPNAKGVYDVDSIGLIKILKQMNEGADWAGHSIGRRASFSVACAVNPIAEDLSLELERFEQKIEAGADYTMTQPLYDLGQLLEFLERAEPIFNRTRRLPIILGIMPLQSRKHAEFLHNELPGVTIPEAVRERMRVAGERGLEVGLEQAQEFLSESQQYVQGVYFMPSFGRYEMVGELVKVLNPAGTSPGPEARSAIL